MAVTGSGSGPGADVQTVSLSQCPGHEVTGLAVSRSGRWVSLWGERGVTLVQMPPRGGVGGRFGGGREELTARSQVRRVYKCTVSDKTGFVRCWRQETRRCRGSPGILAAPRSVIW